MEPIGKGESNTPLRGPHMINSREEQESLLENFHDQRIFVNTQRKVI